MYSVIKFKYKQTNTFRRIVSSKNFNLPEHFKKFQSLLSVSEYSYLKKKEITAEREKIKKTKKKVNFLTKKIFFKCIINDIWPRLGDRAEFPEFLDNSLLLPLSWLRIDRKVDTKLGFDRKFQGRGSAERLICPVSRENWSSCCFLVLFDYIPGIGSRPRRWRYSPSASRFLATPNHLRYPRSPRDGSTSADAGKCGDAIRTPYRLLIPLIIAFQCDFIFQAWFPTRQTGTKNSYTH